MKEFKIENPEKLPPKSKDNFLQNQNCSDMYFGIAQGEEGNVRKYVCYYDFSAKKMVFYWWGREKGFN